MNVLSLFSGIGGFDLGFQRAGMNVIGMCEIDKHAQKVLQRHFPDATLHTDVREVHYERGTVDVICGGFPCQDLSVAGKRRGLAGERSGLWHEFARIIDETEPRWAVIENVPGLFSSAGGRDFAVIIQWLAQRGYGVGWRVLDAQGFGLAQRRKRVFIVGSFGRPSGCTVLLESEGVRRDSSQSRQSRQGNTRATQDGTRNGIAFTLRGPSGIQNGDGAINTNIVPDTIAQTYQDVSPTLRSEAKQSLMSGDGNINAPLAITYASNSVPKISNAINTHEGRTQFYDYSTLLPTTYAIQGNIINREHSGAQGFGIAENAPMYTLTSTDRHAVAFQQNTRDEVRLIQGDGSIVGALTAQPGMKQQNYLTYQDISPTLFPLIGVRRLTPTECERLQGFPDGWTDGQSDSHRYKQLGNAVAVPVAEWIGRRIMGVQ